MSYVWSWPSSLHRQQVSVAVAAQPPGPGAGPAPAFFLGQPVAPLIVGTDIGIDIPGGRPCGCAITLAFP